MLKSSGKCQLLWNGSICVLEASLMTLLQLQLAYFEHLPMIALYIQALEEPDEGLLL